MNFKLLSTVAIAALFSGNALAEQTVKESHKSIDISIAYTTDKSASKTQTGPDYYIQCSNPFTGSYRERFLVDIDGKTTCSALSIYNNSGINTPYTSNLTLIKRTGADGFMIKSYGYPSKYKPIEIQASELIIGCKVSCKDELNVTELNTKNIRTNDITVDMNNAADYVFEDNYDLKSLNEVESYVKANKHLPGVPSAAEMAENGMSVSEMSNLLLEKVEELTLHMIELQKENQALKAKVESLEK